MTTAMRGNTPCGLVSAQVKKISWSKAFDLIREAPGAHDPNLIDTQLDSKHSLSVAPRR